MQLHLITRLRSASTVLDGEPTWCEAAAATTPLIRGDHWIAVSTDVTIQIAVHVTIHCIAHVSVMLMTGTKLGEARDQA